MRDFHGVYFPVPTPFRGEQVALDGLRANFARWNATALAGYVILGSTLLRRTVPGAPQHSGRRRHRRDHGEPGLGRPPVAVRKTHAVLAELAGNGMEDRL
jgi:hypothetical protein